VIIAPQDRELAGIIRESLDQAGLAITDGMDVAPGQGWSGYVEQSIRTADAFVVVISPASVKNAGFLRELTFILRQAEKTRRRIIPIVLEGVDLKDAGPEIEYHLSRIQALRVSSPGEVAQLRRQLYSLGFALSGVTGEFMPMPAAAEEPALDDRWLAGRTGEFAQMPAAPAPAARPTAAAPCSAPPRSAASPLTGMRALFAALFDVLASLPENLGHVLTKLKLPSPSRRETLPPKAVVDDVQFTVTAPATLAIGAHADFIVWAHLGSHQRLVLRKAMAALGIATLQKLLFRSIGPVPVERGSVLSVVLEIDGVEVANPHKRLNWTGKTGNVTFVVFVPEKSAEGTRKASCYVRVDGFEIGRLDFVVRLAARTEKAAEIQPKFTRYRSAFASYASEDRNTVLAAIYGMQKRTPNLEIFLDVMTLRSGEDWEKRLEEEIRKADVFFLFWCRHAAQSEWVAKEWRFAYEAKGIQFIDPVPLEPPELAPPPQELRQRHFNDPILAFMQHPN
jgi:hypothetical protein